MLAVAGAGKTTHIINNLSATKRTLIVTYTMVHEGPDARAMEKRGISTEVGEKNREIRQQNKLLSQLEA